MANQWYLSSAAYSAATAFATSHAYSIGDFVKPTSPTTNNKWIFRCTAAGTSGTEPTWSTAANNNATITSTGATFTNVTGQSAYGWSAAAGDLGTLSNLGSGSTRIAGGDTTYISSDHSESTSSLGLLSSITSSNSAVLMVSVNRAGSVPPVVGDITFGASFASTGAGQFKIDNVCPVYWDNVAFASGGNIYLAFNGIKAVYLKNCTITFTSTGTLCNDDPAGTHTLDNTTIQCANVANSIGSSIYGWSINWINTPSAIVGGTIPTYLFTGSGTFDNIITVRGVDLSAVTTSLVKIGSCGAFYLFDSCKIASGVTRFNNTLGTGCTIGDVVELVNCYDGTNIVNERHTVAGDLTTERTIYLTGGATDDVGGYAHKIVTTAIIDSFVNTMDSFYLDVEQSSVGSSQTATVEIISSTTLTTSDISLTLEFQGTSSSPVTSFATSFLATPLTAAASVTSSSVTWNSSPSTPVKQKLQVTFTPQTAGRLRGIVRVGKASTTVYINPVMTIT